MMRANSRESNLSPTAIQVSLEKGKVGLLHRGRGGVVLAMKQEN
jgi:hypothetical protein